MKNKIEFKKTMLLSCIVIIVVSAIFQFYLLYQYKVYTGNFNKKIGMIVTNVQNQYPNIDKNELIQILNNQEDVETGLLKQYGINLENDSIIIQNDKMFVKFSIINLCFIIGLAMAVLLIFVKYTNSKDKKLGEITKYIEEINKKGITIIMVSHDINFAINNASKILHLKKNIKFFGNTEDYAKSEVGKKFIGGAEID